MNEAVKEYLAAKAKVSKFEKGMLKKLKNLQKDLLKEFGGEFPWIDWGDNDILDCLSVLDMEGEEDCEQFTHFEIDGNNVIMGTVKVSSRELYNKTYTLPMNVFTDPEDVTVESLVQAIKKMHAFETEKNLDIVEAKLSKEVADNEELKQELTVQKAILTMLKSSLKDVEGDDDVSKNLNEMVATQNTVNSLQKKLDDSEMEVNKLQRELQDVKWMLPDGHEALSVEALSV